MCGTHNPSAKAFVVRSLEPFLAPSIAAETALELTPDSKGIFRTKQGGVIADIKKLKLKIQIKIQGEELRVDGKKKDDLQEAMNAIKSIDIGLPIDFVNFRD